MAIRIGREVSRVVPPRRPQDAPLVVTMSPEGLYFREFGRRKKFLLAYSTGYIVAVRQQVEAERREKDAERKARRAAKVAR